MIQIWRVGKVTDEGLDLGRYMSAFVSFKFDIFCSPLPKLAFGIAHNGESVVSLKWCPVGGFAKAEKVCA